MRMLAWWFATFAVLNAVEEPTLADLAATAVIRSPLCAESPQPDTASWPPRQGQDRHQPGHAYDPVG